MENKILEKCHWNEKQQEHLGVLIFNIDQIDVVIKRQKNQIEIQFVDNKKNQLIEVTYSTVENKLLHKTDSEIKTQDDFNRFLDGIDSILKGQKGVFYPKEKIEKLDDMIKPRMR